MSPLFIIVLVIIAGMGLYGWVRGLIRLLFGMLSLIISIAIVSAVNPYITNFLKNDTPLYSSVQDNIQVILVEKMQENGLGAVTSEDEALKTLQGVPFPESWKEQLVEKVWSAGHVSDFLADTSAYFAGIVVSVVAFVITLIVVFVIMRVLMLAINIIDKLPIIHTANHVGGLAVGLVEGLLLVDVFFLTISMFSGNSQTLYESIQANPFLTFFYEHNVLDKVILAITSTKA